jgi:hypothetical protein
MNSPKKCKDVAAIIPAIHKLGNKRQNFVSFFNSVTSNAKLELFVMNKTVIVYILTLFDSQLDLNCACYDL